MVRTCETAPTRKQAKVVGMKALRVADGHTWGEKWNAHTQPHTKRKRAYATQTHGSFHHADGFGLIILLLLVIR